LSEGDLNRIAFSGGYYMDFQPVEKAEFVAVVTPEKRALWPFRIDSASVDSNVVANLSRTVEVFGSSFFMD